MDTVQAKTLSEEILSLGRHLLSWIKEYMSKVKTIDLTNAKDKVFCYLFDGHDDSLVEFEVRYLMLVKNEIRFAYTYVGDPEAYSKQDYEKICLYQTAGNEYGPECGVLDNAMFGLSLPSLINVFNYLTGNY